MLPQSMRLPLHLLLLAQIASRSSLGAREREPKEDAVDDARSPK